MLLKKAARRLSAIACTILIGGFLAATLVRFAPGFGVDEREFDSRLSAESVRSIREAGNAQRNIVQFYARYVTGILRGDLGISQSLARPVTELFAERIPATLKAVGTGLAIGWVLGLGLSLVAAFVRTPVIDGTTAALSSLFLCLPSSVLALVLLLAGRAGTSASLSVSAAVSLVIFPRVFRYARGILAQTSALPHVLIARAKGLPGARVLFAHVLAPAAPSILALAGVSVSVAFGAAIPIEVICDSPGIGQLAWQAALQRDLPLLVNITLLVTVVAVVSSSASDLAIAILSRDGKVTR